jgi:hypothetical protein
MARTRALYQGIGDLELVRRRAHHRSMTRRRLGYLVWGLAFVVIVVPELLASVDAIEQHLPFPTISRTIGHLEVVNPVWEIFPTMLIALFIYALLQLRMPRLGTTVAAPDDDAVPHELGKFWLTSGVFLALVAVATYLASRHWPDQHLAHGAGKQPNFYVGYFLWGGSFLLWVVLPTISAARKKHKYPSFPKTLVNLERWIAGYSTRVAWVVGFLVVWGMAFLLLHLTLYPFPDITRELNKRELVCNGKVVSRMPVDRDPSCRIGGYPNLGG